MTSIRRRPPGGHDTQAANPAAESWRLPAAVIGEIPRLRRYATAWLGNAAAADDLVRDGLERVIAQGDAPEEPQHLRIRMLSLLHGLAEGRTRHPRHRGPVGLPSLSRDLQSSLARGGEARMREVVGAIEQLSDEHRQVLLLIALEGLSYREAADVLGLPLGTVMSRLAAAREDLLARTGERVAKEPSGSNHSVAFDGSGVSELDLHAYIDRELSPDRAKAVKAFLRSHPEPAARLERFADRDEMIRDLYGPLLNRPVPPELLAPLVAPAPQPVERRQWPELTATAAVGLLLLGLVIGWLLGSYFTPAGTVIP